jgi:uncharacterized iron-regulated membrane protein
MGRFEPDITALPGASASLGRRLVKQGKWWLYWVHRWLGIVTCVLSVMWFLSGLVMLYVPFPSWSDEERTTNLPPVAMERITLLPDEAIARAGVTSLPTTFRLEMLGDTPVYRIAAGDERVSLDADTGEPVAGVSTEDALAHVSRVFPGTQPALMAEIDYDQWTVTRRFDAHRPLYQFALGDVDGMIVYVSSKTGEIVQNATRSERFWNWLGAVPHWIYFSPIRKDQELWRQAVMWLSGPLIIGAVAGLWIGILRLRVRQRYSKGRMSPYRGWMKWHHVGGLIGGVFLTTWIASGWLSVNPFKWFARTQLTDTQLADFAGWSPELRYGTAREALPAAGAREISFLSVAGEPLMLSRNGGNAVLADAKTGLPVVVEDAKLVSAAQRAFPAAPMLKSERLVDEDLYWYSHHSQRALPILKVVFGDAASTWLFVDPATASIASLRDRSARTYRWLFNFLHDYDLPILLRNQPARDILVWVLSIAGLVISVSGVVIGWRTLTRR